MFVHFFKSLFNKSRFFFNLVSGLTVGLLVGVAVLAFVGPGDRPLGDGNPDFWIKSGNDIYYNPVGNGNIGIGMINPGQKLSVVGVIESTSGGFRFPDSTTQTTAATGGVNYWTLSGSDYIPIKLVIKSASG